MVGDNHCCLKIFKGPHTVYPGLKPADSYVSDGKKKKWNSLVSLFSNATYFKRLVKPF